MEELDTVEINKQINRLGEYLKDQKLDTFTKQAILEGALGVERAINTAEATKFSFLAVINNIGKQ